LRAVFSDALAAKLQEPVTQAYETLLAKGARVAVQEVAQ